MTNEKIYPNTVPTKVAFIGLGTMGFPMAGHLKRAGHDVCVYNRTTAKAENWVKTYGGRMAPTPRDAAKGAKFVFTCVGNDDDLRSVVLGEDGVFSGMTSGAVLWDHTTASAIVARELAEEAGRRGLGFVDAPVSGGEAGAQRGVLTVLCGGDELPVHLGRPIVAAYASQVTHLGGPGSGQLAKMVNQICIAGCVQGLAEGIAFGERAGLDMLRVLDAMSGGAASSWQMVNRGKTMVEGKFDFGFAVDWMRKDLGIVLDEARRNGSLLPVAAMVDEFYKEVQTMGGGRWDTSSLIERLRRRAK